MSELQEKLDEIKSEKDTKLTSENLVKGVECMGVAGEAEVITDKITSPQYLFMTAGLPTAMSSSKNWAYVAAAKWGTILQLMDTSDYSYLFAYMIVNSSASNYISTDFSVLDMSNISNIDGMFCGCSGMTSCTVTDWDMSNITSLAYLFYGCGFKRMNFIKGIATWDVSGITNIKYMFANCTSLTTTSIDTFLNMNWESLTNITGLFSGDVALSGELDMTSLDVSKVTSMSRLFYNCYGVTALDVSNWDTINVTNMSFMFYNCYGLTSLDVSRFDTSNVTDMSCMFYNCYNLLMNLGDSSDLSETTGYPKVNIFKDWGSADGFYAESMFGMDNQLSLDDLGICLNLSGWTFNANTVIDNNIVISNYRIREIDVSGISVETWSMWYNYLNEQPDVCYYMDSMFHGEYDNTSIIYVHINSESADIVNQIAEVCQMNGYEKLANYIVWVY